MSKVAKVVYRIGSTPKWYDSDIHDRYLEERLIETSIYMYGNDVVVEFGYNWAKPFQKKTFNINGNPLSVTEFEPITLLWKVKKDGEETKGVKQR